MVAETTCHKISVIIPVYNTAQYLSRCLNSVINNTYTNLEIICVNDGSTDNSLEILNSYAARDQRISVINKKNGGVSKARNVAMEQATGEFIAFIDSDDWVHPQYFEAFMTVANAKRADVVICEPQIVHSLDDVQQSKFSCFHLLNKSESLSLELTMHNSNLKAHIWGRVYRRTLLKHTRFDINMKYREDTAFNMSVLCFAGNIHVFKINQQMYYYFMRGNSAVHTLPIENIMPVIAYNINSANRKETSLIAKKFFVIEALKCTLAFRYLAMYRYTKMELREICSGYFKACWQLIHELNNISFKTKAQYKTLTKFPHVYRAYRILGDKTLLQYEKNEKAKRGRQRE